MIEQLRMGALSNGSNLILLTLLFPRALLPPPPPSSSSPSLSAALSARRERALKILKKIKRVNLTFLDCFLDIFLPCQNYAPYDQRHLEKEDAQPEGVHFLLQKKHYFDFFEPVVFWHSEQGFNLDPPSLSVNIP